MASSNDLKAQFDVFCNFGAGGGGKTTLTTKNCTKMFKDCKLYGKSLTTTDTDIAFSKVKTKGKTEINFDEFKKLLDEIAPKYQKDHKSASPAEAVTQMQDKICQSSTKLEGVTKTSKSGGVDRMTDHKLYTGSHQQRFDESGKGKGITGREELAKNDGYVGNYKGEGTYDKNH